MFLSHRMKECFGAKSVVGSEELGGSGKCFFIVHQYVATKNVRQITDILLQWETLAHLTVVSLNDESEIEEAANYAFSRVMGHIDCYVGTIQHEGIISAHNQAKETWASNYDEGTFCGVAENVHIGALFHE